MEFNEEKMSRLEEIIEDERDEVLFREVKSCFKVGALRAAYIINWIMIAESLKNKFYKIARKDNVISKKVISKIEDKEENKKPTDGLLIEEAKDYGLISSSEFEELNHIKKMRGIYAHPLEEAPNPENVYAAVKTGVDSVLSKPPLLRHGYVQQLINRMFEYDYYLDDWNESINKFAYENAKRIHPETYPYLLNNIAKKFNEIIDDPDLNNIKTRALKFTESFFNEIEFNFSEEDWGIENIICAYQEAAALLLAKATFWQQLSDHEKGMIFNLLEVNLENMDGDIPKTTCIRYINNLYENDLLSERQENVVNTIYETTDVKFLVKADVKMELCANKIIKELESKNWYRQNPAVQALNNAGSEQCKDLAENKQEEIGRNILQSAQGEANESINFINHLADNEHEWPKSFLCGLILECFVNEEREFRFKTGYFEEAIKTLKPLSVSEEEEILLNLKENLLNSKPQKSWINDGDDEEVLSYLKKAKKFIKNKNLLEEIIEIFREEKIDLYKDNADDFDVPF